MGKIMMITLRDKTNRVMSQSDESANLFMGFKYITHFTVFELIGSRRKEGKG
jgi:hypothetical protein